MTCIILRHQPDALVLKLRFFDDRKREFPGKNEISGPHCGQKWGPEAVEPSFSPGKTAEKKRNFKKRQRRSSFMTRYRAMSLVLCLLVQRRYVQRRDSER